MTFPANATKVHMDAGTDDPAQARVELADLVDKFNTLLAHFPSFSQTLVGRSTAALARTDLAVGWTIIANANVSNAASLDIINLTADFRAYKLVFDDMLPITDAVGLRLRTDTNNGASFDAGASDYSWVYTGMRASTTTATPLSSADELATQIVLTSDLCGNAVGEEISGEITLYNPFNASSRTKIISQLAHRNSTPDFDLEFVAGLRLLPGTENAFQLRFESGNISTMNYTLYGLERT